MEAQDDPRSAIDADVVAGCEPAHADQAWERFGVPFENQSATKPSKDQLGGDSLAGSEASASAVQKQIDRRSGMACVPSDPQDDKRQTGVAAANGAPVPERPPQRHRLNDGAGAISPECSTSTEQQPASVVGNQRCSDLIFDLCGRSRDWRMQFATRPPSRYDRELARRTGDKLLQRAMSFVYGTREGQPGLDEQFPEIAAADGLNDDAAFRPRLQVLVLGRVSFTVIGERLQLPAAVVAAWAGLFFDVVTRLDSPGWIHQRIIFPTEQRDPDFAAMLRQAYILGEPAAIALDDIGQAVVPVQKSDRLFQRRVKLNINLDRASTLAAFTPSTALRFVQKSFNYMAEIDRIDLERQRLQEKCRETHRRHLLIAGQRQRELEEARRETLEVEIALRRLERDVRGRGARPTSRSWTLSDTHPYQESTSVRNRQRDGSTKVVR